MLVQPSTPQPELHLSHPSHDSLPPHLGQLVEHLRPAAHRSGEGVLAGTSWNEGGGAVAAVEISLDHGASWHPAELEAGVWVAGSSRWETEWKFDYSNRVESPTGSRRIVDRAMDRVMVRATDDSGNRSPPLELDVNDTGA